jgi:hypothetical protein
MKTRKPKTDKVSPVDAFLALPDAEKERVWASFNREIPLSETRAISTKERREHEQARRRGRPKKGEGAEPVTLTMERGLLRRADAFAAQSGLTRSQLVATALANLLPTENTPQASITSQPASRRHRKAG